MRELEERLNDKKEQMLEKELVLEEVSSLADRLRKQAADGREDTLELANKVNEFQSRIRRYLCDRECRSECVSTRVHRIPSQDGSAHKLGRLELESVTVSRSDFVAVVRC